MQQQQNLHIRFYPRWQLMLPLSHHHHHTKDSSPSLQKLAWIFSLGFHPAMKKKHWTCSKQCLIFYSPDKKSSLKLKRSVEILWHFTPQRLKVVPEVGTMVHKTLIFEPLFCSKLHVTMWLSYMYIGVFHFLFTVNSEMEDIINLLHLFKGFDKLSHTRVCLSRISTVTGAVINKHIL